ncbi:class I SAM-dependent methyltransferase [Bacteroidota bacterium]
MHEEEKYTYESEWIKHLESEEHWRSYWHQQKLMESLVKPGENILEIGIGSGFTADYLKSKNINVKTIDIDKEKGPDIVANIVEYEFSDKYDHVLAFEVFEHIPYDDFEHVLQKLYNCTNQCLFLSIPINEKTWIFNELYLHVLGNIRFGITTRRNKLTTNNHFWEVRYKKFSKKRVEETFRKYNFIIKKKFRFRTQLFYCLERK